MENSNDTLNIESSIEPTAKTKQSKPKAKSTVKKSKKMELIETEIISDEINEEPRIISSKKKTFVVADYSKEFEWIPVDEIELENPLRFIFTLATNLELAHYNDSLMRLEGNAIVTYQNLVDIELLTKKLIRVENIDIEGEIQTAEGTSRLSFIIDKVLDLDTINELSGFIRVMSNCKGKLYS